MGEIDENLKRTIDELVKQAQERIDTRVNEYERTHGKAPSIPTLIVFYPSRDLMEDNGR